jgi:hypothetical protein
MSAFTQQNREPQSRTTPEGYQGLESASAIRLPHEGAAPGASVQQGAAAILNESPKAQAHLQLQKELNQSPKVQAQLQFQKELNQSPKVQSVMQLQQQSQCQSERLSTPVLQLEPPAEQQTSHPVTINQRAELDPSSLTQSDVSQLQRAIGNQAVGRLSAQTAQHQPIQKKENNIGPTAQRFPIPLNQQENEQEDEQEEVLTDSKHSWMRMIFRGDLGQDTFELLRVNGQPSGSFMIHESAYDQYRFSSDGRDFDDRFPPHFMENITGDATINDEGADDEPLYSYVGEYGVGYRPARRMSARLEVSGLISCIGFVLESESAGFACHMVVTGGVPQNEGVLKRQVNALVARFAQYAGEQPDNCQLLYDETTYHGRPGWLSWMIPDGVRTIVEPAHGDYGLNITGRTDDVPTVMWRGDPIRY